MHIGIGKRRRAIRLLTRLSIQIPFQPEETSMKVAEAVEHMRKTHAGIAGGHRAAAEHARGVAEHHRAMSKCHGAAMGKAVAGDPQHTFHKEAKGHDDAAAEAHDAFAEDQDSRSAYHEQMAEECSKAAKVAGDADLSKGSPELLRRLEIVEGTIIPTKISALTPTAPGVRAVPRAGQRAFADKPVVATQFSKLVEIEE
jgi:hypothetical protein